MSNYTFTFHFPNLDSDRQHKTVEAWGGNLGTAFNRAWKKLKGDRMYTGIKRLRPTTITIELPE